MAGQHTQLQRRKGEAPLSLRVEVDKMVLSGVQVQALGQRTVQLLLANNANCPTLLRWVVDRCYDNQPGAAQLCFHALATTMETLYASF